MRTMRWTLPLCLLFAGCFPFVLPQEHAANMEDLSTDQDDTDVDTDGDVNVNGSLWYADADLDGYGDAETSKTASAAPDGYVDNDDDCDDTRASVHPGAIELCDGLANSCGDLATAEADEDGDGYVLCTIDSAGWDGDSDVVGGDDCDDEDAKEYPGVTWYVDGEEDGYGAGVGVDCERANPTDVTNADDCDDEDADENPDASWWRDSDGDGYGNEGKTPTACERNKASDVDNDDDCNDNDDTVYTGADELCDGQANACGTLPADEADEDADGYVACTFDADGWDGAAEVVGDEDCDDADEDEAPGVYWYADSDSDGFGNAADAGTLCERNAPTDVANAEDCDDSDDKETPEVTWYADVDADGFGDPDSTPSDCERAAGTDVTNAEDCNDADITIWPGATELCDGLQNDCDASKLPNTEADKDDDFYVACTIDADGWMGDLTVVGGDDCDDGDAEETPAVSWYTDGDEDGYGDPAATPTQCERTATTDVTNNTDCDDSDEDENPGVTWYVDGDDDEYGSDVDAGNTCERLNATDVANNLDCDDGTGAFSPDVTDVVGDQIDQNCDDADGVDEDRDSHASEASGGEDCDDDDASVSPSGTEVANDVDDDCNELKDDTTEAYDDDNDGFCEGWDDDDEPSTPGICTDGSDIGDCDDESDKANPEETEVANGVDDDCVDGIDNATEAGDDDADGYCEGWDDDQDPETDDVCTDGSEPGDCEDEDELIGPLATDLTDAGDIDDNCDGVDGTDIDGDGYAAIWSGGDDCDDDPADDTVVDQAMFVYPGATYYQDDDGDDYGAEPDTPTACGLPAGFSVLDGDCDDVDSPDIYPDAYEIHNDGIDQDCDSEEGDTTWVSVEIYNFYATGYATDSDGVTHFWSESSLGYESTDVVAVDGKRDRACWLHADGSLFACSFDGDEPPTGTFVDVGVGHYDSCCEDGFACAVSTDGTLACWGDDTLQLPTDDDFIEVECDAAGCCAEDGDNNLSCFGHSDLTPPNKTFSDVAITGTWACGIRTSDSQVECWGDSTMLGLYSPPSGTFGDIHADSGNFCGATGDGSAILCWGSAATNGWIPDLTGLPLGETYKQVSINKGTDICAVTGQGTLLCWMKTGDDFVTNMPL
jgi:large repetitive protein